VVKVKAEDCAVARAASAETRKVFMNMVSIELIFWRIAEEGRNSCKGVVE
jgi:hypothetical protein